RPPKLLTPTCGAATLLILALSRGGPCRRCHLARFFLDSCSWPAHDTRLCPARCGVRLLSRTCGGQGAGPQGDAFAQIAWQVLMRTLGFCLAGCVWPSLPACGSRGAAKESLVGTWNGIDRGTTIVGTWVFTNDGKLTKTFKSVEMPGTYEWVDADHIKTEL